MDTDKILEAIAAKHLFLETLTTSNSGDDFKEQAVWQIRAALEEAFKAGQESKK